jgi:hypothetical protein
VLARRLTARTPFRFTRCCVSTRPTMLRRRVDQPARSYAGPARDTAPTALVYYLRAVPWVVPGFSVATHTENLFRLQARLEATGAPAFGTSSYVIEARKST